MSLTIESLPLELLLRVLRELSVGNLARLARVNKNFRKLVYDDSLWSYMLLPEVGNELSPLLIQNARNIFSTQIPRRKPAYSRIDRAGFRYFEDQTDLAIAKALRSPHLTPLQSKILKENVMKWYVVYGATTIERLLTFNQEHFLKIKAAHLYDLIKKGFITIDEGLSMTDPQLELLYVLKLWGLLNLLVSVDEALLLTAPQRSFIIDKRSDQNYFPKLYYCLTNKIISPKKFLNMPEQELEILKDYSFLLLIKEKFISLDHLLKLTDEQRKLLKIKFFVYRIRIKALSVDRVLELSANMFDRFTNDNFTALIQEECISFEEGVSLTNDDFLKILEDSRQKIIRCKGYSLQKTLALPSSLTNGEAMVLTSQGIIQLIAGEFISIDDALSLNPEQFLALSNSRVYPLILSKLITITQAKTLNKDSILTLHVMRSFIQNKTMTFEEAIVQELTKRHVQEFLSLQALFVVRKLSFSEADKLNIPREKRLAILAFTDLILNNQISVDDILSSSEKEYEKLLKVKEALRNQVVSQQEVLNDFVEERLENLLNSNICNAVKKGHLSKKDLMEKNQIECLEIISEKTGIGYSSITRKALAPAPQPTHPTLQTS